MRTRLACMAMGTLLAGCSALPSLVQGPKPAELNTPAAALATTSNSFDVPTIKKGGDAAAIAGLYARKWRDAARERLVERDVLNNTQFGLVVGGAVSAAKNSLTTAKWLLAGAGGTGLVSDRYQVEAQGIAYKQGAEAMECMRNEVNLVPSSIWSQYGADGELLGQGLNDGTDAKVNETKEALEVLLRVIHDRLSQATNKLYENVSSKSLRVPKADDIAKAVSDQQRTSAESGDKANAFTQARTKALVALNNPDRVQGQVTPDGGSDQPRPQVPPVVPSAAAVKTALELPTKLATCVTKIP